MRAGGRPLLGGVEDQLDLLDGRLPVELAQPLGVGRGQLAVVGVPHTEHLGRGVQDEPAHRQPEVVGAEVEQVELAAERPVVEVGPERPQPLHRLPPDELVVEVPVGRGLPAVLGVDPAAHGDPGGQRVPDGDEQRSQPGDDGVGGVLHDRESAGRV